MDEIPSALDRALERVEKLGKASSEELQRANRVEDGQRLGARYVKGEVSLLTELNRIEDEQTRKWVGEGAQEVMIRNIDLPSSDSAKKQNKASMEGIKLVKTDKARTENVFSKMRQVFDHYNEMGEHQRKQAYEDLKANITAKLRQAMQQQSGGMPPLNLGNIETNPQFQMEWRRVQGQLDSQYLVLLKEYKEQLAAIP
jgi:formate dehydrogenase maturation protein FdhE